MTETKSLAEALRMMKSLQEKLNDCIDTLESISGCKKYIGSMTEEIATGMCLRAEQTLERVKK